MARYLDSVGGAKFGEDAVVTVVGNILPGVVFPRIGIRKIGFSRSIPFPSHRRYTARTFLDGMARFAVTCYVIFSGRVWMPRLRTC